jgi:hypothetical protein
MRLGEIAKKRLEVPGRKVEGCLAVETNEELQREKIERKQKRMGRDELRGEVTNVQYL